MTVPEGGGGDWRLLGSGHQLPPQLTIGQGPHWGGWLGWVVACTRGGLPRPACPSLTGSIGPYPGCLVSQPQTADDPRTPPRRWWEGDAAVPVCPRMLGSWGGGGFKAGAHLCRSPAGRGWRVWGVVCARCSGP